MSAIATGRCRLARLPGLAIEVGCFLRQERFVQANVQRRSAVVPMATRDLPNSQNATSIAFKSALRRFDLLCRHRMQSPKELRARLIRFLPRFAFYQ